MTNVQRGGGWVDSNVGTNPLVNHQSVDNIAIPSNCMHETSLLKDGQYALSLLGSDFLCDLGPLQSPIFLPLEEILGYCSRLLTAPADVALWVPQTASKNAMGWCHYEFGMQKCNAQKSQVAGRMSVTSAWKVSGAACITRMTRR